MSKTKTYRRWTADEVKTLHEHYRSASAADLAALLGRTEDSVWEKAVREGLAKKGQRRGETTEE